jgi:hypothetical protein
MEKNKMATSLMGGNEIHYIQEALISTDCSDEIPILIS